MYRVALATATGTLWEMARLRAHGPRGVAIGKPQMGGWWHWRGVSRGGMPCACAWGERRCLGSEDPRRGAPSGRIGNGHCELELELELKSKSELDVMSESELELMLELDLLLESELELKWMGLRGPSE